MGRLTDEEQNALLKEEQKKWEQAEVAAQNPRALVVDAAYIERRKEIATELLSYYKFLIGMYLPDDALKQPPAEGWDYINAERFGFLGKSDAVLDLYKHIPYIAGEVDEGLQVDHDIACIDYMGKIVDRSVTSQSADLLEPDQFDGQDEPIWERLKEPQHVAILGRPLGNRRGAWIAIDLRDGKAAHLLPLNEVDCQTAWEHESIKELLDEAKQKFLRLESVPIDPKEIISDTKNGDPDPHAVNIQKLYHKYGWPSKNYDKENCLAEVQEVHKAYWDKKLGR